MFSKLQLALQHNVLPKKRFSPLEPFLPDTINIGNSQTGGERVKYDLSGRMTFVTLPAPLLIRFIEQTELFCTISKNIFGFRSKLCHASVGSLLIALLKNFY